MMGAGELILKLPGLIKHKVVKCFSFSELGN